MLATTTTIIRDSRSFVHRKYSPANFFHYLRAQRNCFSRNLYYYCPPPVYFLNWLLGVSFRISHICFLRETEFLHRSSSRHRECQEFAIVHASPAKNVCMAPLLTLPRMYALPIPTTILPLRKRHHCCYIFISDRTNDDYDHIKSICSCRKDGVRSGKKRRRDHK
jgi:hypothetical protein